MSEMEDEDCGCDSLDNKEPIKPVEIDNIRNKMGETRQTLETMLSTMENLNLDFSQFSRMEEEINKISHYMYSGEFVNSMEKLISKAEESDPRNSEAFQAAMNYRKQYMSGPDFPSVDVPKNKTPIGYVWVDENGEQKFSVEKPTDIVAMPVYGE